MELEAGCFSFPGVFILHREGNISSFAYVVFVHFFAHHREMPINIDMHTKINKARTRTFFIYFISVRYDKVSKLSADFPPEILITVAL